MHIHQRVASTGSIQDVHEDEVWIEVHIVTVLTLILMQMNRSALCLAGLASLASALILENPTGTFPGASVEEYWETQAGDPSQFTLLLANIDGGVPLALAASVNTSVGHVFFQTPDVPVG